MLPTINVWSSIKRKLITARLPQQDSELEQGLCNVILRLRLHLHSLVVFFFSTFLENNAETKEMGTFIHVPYKKKPAIMINVWTDRPHNLSYVQPEG